MDGRRCLTFPFWTGTKENLATAQNDDRTRLFTQAQEHKIINVILANNANRLYILHVPFDLYVLYIQLAVLALFHSDRFVSPSRESWNLMPMLNQ